MRMLAGLFRFSAMARLQYAPLRARRRALAHTGEPCPALKKGRGRGGSRSSRYRDGGRSLFYWRRGSRANRGIDMRAIEMHLTSLPQLYDSLDPAPFHDKALDREAEAYLIESAIELPGRTPLHLLVHGPEALRDSLPEITASIHAHFGLALERIERQRRQRLRVGLMALWLGLGVLAAALLLRHMVRGLGGPGVISEGLLIVGWVGLWRPAEILLFDRLETAAERAVLARLAVMTVEFRTQAPTPPSRG